MSVKKCSVSLCATALLWAAGGVLAPSAYAEGTSQIFADSGTYTVPGEGTLRVVLVGGGGGGGGGGASANASVTGEDSEDIHTGGWGGSAGGGAGMDCLLSVASGQKLTITVGWGGSGGSGAGADGMATSVSRDGEELASADFGGSGGQGGDAVAAGPDGQGDHGADGTGGKRGTVRGSSCGGELLRVVAGAAGLPGSASSSDEVISRAGIRMEEPECAQAGFGGGGGKGAYADYPEASFKLLKADPGVDGKGGCARVTFSPA